MPCIFVRTSEQVMASRGLAKTTMLTCRLLQGFHQHKHGACTASECMHTFPLHHVCMSTTWTHPSCTLRCHIKPKSVHYSSGADVQTLSNCFDAVMQPALAWPCPCIHINTCDADSCCGFALPPCMHKQLNACIPCGFRQ